MLEWTGSHCLAVEGKEEEGILGNSQVSGLTKSRRAGI